VQGVLRLVEEQLFVPEDRNFALGLAVDRFTFRAGDIESCVRVDE